MYYENLFIKTGYDNIPDFSKEQKQYVLGLFEKVIEKLNSPQAYTISEQRNRLYKALELFKDDFELNKTFTDYTGDVFKAIATNQAFNPELKEDHVKMLIRNKKSEILIEAVCETLKYFRIMECYYPEEYNTQEMLNLIRNKRIDLNL